MSRNDPRDSALERAAITLLNAGVWDQAAALFATLLGRLPAHTMAWYGLANALLRLSAQQHSPAYLQQAYACALRAVDEDASNRLAHELLAFMRERTPLRELGYHALSAYAVPPTRLADELMSIQHLDEARRAMADWQERMGLVMLLGDQQEERFVPLLLAALEHDDHPDVRMAAMKRLRPWGAVPEVRASCERLALGTSWRDIEPYFSMTLRGMRAGWALALAERLAEPPAAGGPG